MGFTALVLCLFVLHCQAEGDRRKYVKTGTDLLLDAGEPVTLKKVETMLWKFNSTVNIVRLTINNTVLEQNYTGRADFFPQNKSLLLKNVQKTDSGEYRAEVLGFTNRVLAQYQVTVVDPVSDVKLEVKQCSSDQSDLTVTCTTLDTLLNSTFICDKTSCSHEGGEPVQNIPPGASMKVYLKTGSVTCYHSNQVSSTNTSRTTEDLCRKEVKNVQKTDSGEYRAGFISVKDRVLVQYQVTVVDPVSDVKLEVKQCSPDRSDLTVTCTTLDALLNSTFICENTTCSHEGGEPVLNIPPGASMKVYLKNGSVTCHHSNQVSSTEDTKTVEDLCRKDPVNSALMPYSKIFVPIVIIAVILVATCGAAYYLRSRQQGETEEVKDPVYADVSKGLRGDQHPRPGPRNDAQVESSDVIYSAVAAHRAAPTEPFIKMQTECYYATVKKTAKS